MSLSYAFALALAAALLDVTLGYPYVIERRIGAPTRWIATWLAIVRLGTRQWGGRLALVLYLAPILFAALVIALVLPDGPIGFAVNALLASAFCGRQRLDAKAREAARLWENEGPYEALAAAEALGSDEAEPRLGRAGAAAIAARFADEVVAPTLFILVGGLVGAAVCRALVIAGGSTGALRQSSEFELAVAAVERWTVAPAARAAAFFLALTAGRFGWRALGRPATKPTAPAEAVMLAALGDPKRDEPAYWRAALALFRRAAAAELAVLALGLVMALLGAGTF